MKKDKKAPKEKEKKSSGKAFLKKRAPIYLAVITLVIVFIIPELTASSLRDYIPDDLENDKKKALDIFLAYRGPNNSGLNAIDVLSEKIENDYPGEKIFDNKDTTTVFLVEKINEVNDDEYKIKFDFQTKSEEIFYEWSVNISSGEILSLNNDAKKILEIVNYSK